MGSRHALRINCDDMGMHPTINEAIVDLLVRQPMATASLMAVGPAFDHALSLLRSHQIHKIGIHLCLNAEYPNLPFRPVLPPESIPSLVDKNGYLRPESPSFSAQWRLDEVSKELRAQIFKIQDSGLEITHLDGHLFFYEPNEAGSAFLPVVQKLSDELQVPYRLRPNQPTHFIWETHETHEERETYYRSLLETQEEGEIILHPAKDEDALKAFTGAGHRRVLDYRIFMQEEFCLLEGEPLT